MRSHRKTRRPRREVSPVTLLLLRPAFRCCWTRDAWILRGVGDRYGPVLVLKDTLPHAEYVPERPEESSRKQGRFARPHQPTEPDEEGADTLEPHALRTPDR